MGEYRKGARDFAFTVLPVHSPHQFGELLAHRLVQKASEGAIELMHGDEFHNVGEILVRSPKVAQTAGKLGLDELCERKDGQPLDLRDVFRLARVGEGGGLTGAFTLARLQ